MEPKYPIDVRISIPSPARGSMRKYASLTFLHPMNGINRLPRRITTPGCIH
jgi:hypothetical protein